jgi:hypothetical protein
VNVLAAGPFATVVMTSDAGREFRSAPEKGRAEILRAMRLYAERGPLALNATQFRNEGRFPLGERRGAILVQAFKGHALRVYGGVMDRRFVCVAVKEKKCDGTHPELLRRVAHKLADVSVFRSD